MNALSCWRPLFLKELRTRMRTRAATVAANLYVVALAVALAFVFLGSDGFGSASGSAVGRAMFAFVALVHAAFVGVVCPLLAASLVTGEREQKTFDSLCAAPVSAGSLLGAKLLSVAVYFFALQCMTLPMMSISFILGGVSPEVVAVVAALTAAFTFFSGAVGLYASCRFRRSIASVPAAGIAVLVGAVVAVAVGPDDTVLGAFTPAAIKVLVGDSDAAVFFGASFDPWPLSLALMILGAAVLFEMARQRMLFARERRPVLARLLVLVLAALALAFECGLRVDASPEDNCDTIPNVTAVLLVFLFFAAPWLGARRRAVAENLPPPGPGGPGRVARLLLDGRVFLTLLLLVCAAGLAWTVETAGHRGMGDDQSPWLPFLGVVVPCAFAWLRFAERLTARCAPARRPVFAGIAYAVCGALAGIPAYLDGAGIKAGGLMLLASPLVVGSRILDYLEEDSLPMRLVRGHNPVWVSVAIFITVAIVLWLIPLRRPSIAPASGREEHQAE